MHQFPAALALGKLAAGAGESCGKPAFILGSAPCILLRISVISAKTHLDKFHLQIGIQLDSVSCSLQKLCACVRNASSMLFPILLTQQCVRHLTSLYSALISIKMKIKHTLWKNLCVKLIHVGFNLTRCKFFQARPGRQHVINLVCKFKPVSNSCYQM